MGAPDAPLAAAGLIGAASPARRPPRPPPPASPPAPPPPLTLAAAVAGVVALAALLQPAFAGFACLSNPCFFGICIDDLNSSYTCYCIDGYTGAQCQTNWDECWSSPCRNGGTCTDGVASFNCSCPQGFMGTECEQDFDECASNPCLNNATCEDAVNGYSCQCLPGYSGPLCEVDEAVCNATGMPRCAHGGSCREGPGDAFSCSCVEGWTGPLCEDPVDECASSPCQNGGVCIDRVAGYACACLLGYTGRNCERLLQHCDDSPCENGALCLQEGDRAVCYCVPDFHGSRCEFQYDECQLGPRCLNGGTCLDGVDNFTCSCPPQLTGQFCECLMQASGELDCSFVGTLPPPPSTLSPPTTLAPPTPSHSPATEEPATTREPRDTSGSTSPAVASGPSEGTAPPHTGTTPATTGLWEGGDSTERTRPFTRTEATSSTDEYSTTAPESSLEPGPSVPPPSSPVPGHSFPAEEWSTTAASTLSPSSTLPSAVTTLPPTDTTSFFWEFSPSEERTPPSGIMTPAATPTGTGTADVTTATETATGTATGAVETSMPAEGRTSERPWDTTWRTEEGHVPTGDTGVVWSTATASAETEVPEPGEGTSESSTSTSSEEPSTEEPDCMQVPCLNGGTCVLTAEGFRCSCPLHWTGARCERASGVRVAAFGGRSWLRHRLPPTASGAGGAGARTRVQVTARTLAPAGLLMHAQLAQRRYFALLVEDGRMHFRFSCGRQTMHFTETQTRVDDGRDLDVIVTLQVVRSANGSLQCVGAVRINASLAMGGEQVAAAAPTQGRTAAWLHLGGLPPGAALPIGWPPAAASGAGPDTASQMPGFTGCMHSLKVDNATRRILGDAVAGADVGECTSLACLSNPCHGAATCLQQGASWSCLCPAGFVGPTCEQSVCHNNPCRFGATCAPFPGSGFVCLCPLGKHGLLCEHDLEVEQPSFSASVGGLASFVAYPLPAPLHHSLELRFRFRPDTSEQVALLAFVGQEGAHDAHSDHLAVSFIKGYIVLTWNLGSGPRRIFTPRPVSPRANRPHFVRLGRVGQSAWLLVDNLGNVSGRSPGRLTQLNTRSMLYLGGHESANFSLLPHDLPLHTGFAGCLFDVELVAGRSAVALRHTRPATGRGVGQCGTAECNAHACQHGGACLSQGASFTCLCPDGWFGPTCAQRHNPCDASRHDCAAGATCVPLPGGFACDCPPGRAGRRCERDEPLTDVALSGERSFLAVGGAGALREAYACVRLELRPLADRGLVAFAGALATDPAPRAFFALSLQGGVLELRLAPGRWSGAGGRGVGEPLVLRSGRVLALGRWHRVLAGRYGRRVFLRVDGSVSTALLPPGSPPGVPGDLLYLGGVPDLSQLPMGALAGPATALRGCVRRLALNWQRKALDAGALRAGRNLEDCDGTACGGDACYHGGTCRLNGTRAACACTPHYTGNRCESALPCTDRGCSGRGRCVKEEDDGAGAEPEGSGKAGARCHCQLGWAGDFCEQAVKVAAPQFGGDGYLVVRPPQQMQMPTTLPHPPPRGPSRTPATPAANISFLYLNFSTTQPDGLLLWTAKAGDFVGVGLDSGRLKLVWTHSNTSDGGAASANTSTSGEAETLLLPAGAGTTAGAGASLADGAWHALAARLHARRLEIWVDGKLALTHPRPAPLLHADGDFYIGGLPESGALQSAARGFFAVGFSGCVGELAWSNDSVVTDFSHFEGENVASCDFAET